MQNFYRNINERSSMLPWKKMVNLVCSTLIDTVSSCVIHSEPGSVAKCREQSFLVEQRHRQQSKCFMPLTYY